MAASLAAAGLLAVVPAAPAAAHVRVTPDTAAPGGYAVLTFRVPDEDPRARTTALALTLPTTHPFASVSVEPVPGWSVRVLDATLPTPVTDDDGATLTRAPRTVTWTAAAGGGIGPGQFQQFRISVGPLPDSGSVVVPATQTYSDGTVVRWDEPTPADGTEPEHPAPAFAITPSGPPSASASASAAADIAPVAGGAAPAAGTGTRTGTGQPDTTARWLGVAGIVVGLLGVLVGVGGVLAGRRRPA